MIPRSELPCAATRTRFPAWSAGASLLPPLFSGGKLKEQVNVRTAEQKQAVAEYGRVGARAFAEVENALSADFSLAAREVILTVEPSAAFGEDVMILPGGMVEPGENQAVTANRELQEEAGYAAHRLTFLGELRPWSKYLQTRSFIYLGQDLAASRLVGDEDYTIGVEFVPLTDFESWIADGRIKDARVIAALYMARAALHDSQDTLKSE